MAVTSVNSFPSEFSMREGKWNHHRVVGQFNASGHITDPNPPHPPTSHLPPPQHQHHQLQQLQQLQQPKMGNEEFRLTRRRSRDARAPSLDQRRNSSPQFPPPPAIGIWTWLTSPWFFETDAGRNPPRIPSRILQDRSWRTIRAEFLLCGSDCWRCGGAGGATGSSRCRRCHRCRRRRRRCRCRCRHRSMAAL